MSERGRRVQIDYYKGNGSVQDLTRCKAAIALYVKKFWKGERKQYWKKNYDEKGKLTSISIESLPIVRKKSGHAKEQVQRQRNGQRESDAVAVDRNNSAIVHVGYVACTK